MLIIRTRTFKENNPTVRILTSESPEGEVATFKKAWTRHFDGLMLLEFCDEGTGISVAKILQEKLNIDISAYNIVIRVDKQVPENNVPLRNTLYLFIRPLSLIGAPPTQSPYDYILQRWDEGKIFIRWVET